jgi:hypothetical protein
MEDKVDYGIGLTYWSPSPSILAGRIRQPYAGVRDYELGYWTPQMLLMRRSNFHIPRDPNFEPKNYFAEDKTRRNGPLFRRNSAFFAKQKTYGIPFRVIPQSTEKKKLPEFCFATIFAFALSNN